MFGKHGSRVRGEYGCSRFAQHPFELRRSTPFASLDLMAPGMLAKMFVAASWGMALGQLRGLSISQNRSNATNVSNATDSDALRSTRGSCQQYGCPSTYIRSQACQCNSRCKDYGNCCSDIASCSAGAPPAEGGSPAARAPMEGVSGHPDPSKSYPSYPGFTLALVEEFESPLDLDNDPIWTLVGRRPLRRRRALREAAGSIRGREDEDQCRPQPGLCHAGLLSR